MKNGIDLKKELREGKLLTYEDFIRLITVPLNGYKSVKEYLVESSPIRRINGIKVPTLFMNSLNDPFLKETLDFSAFHRNENIVLATNKYAGHMGYH